ncbi:MAG: arsenic resistance protein [Candidatus Odinarchaeum yellowstonii]|uniref:Arsenic resistance protein n=1 Tax=Odinarchaeota yellowstonii (strain LCB_4) TaxID=1841599 RepID=A0AAF0IBX7_ODILC|nr:MAG: arsenic resistance protein [Candidatus Odinarchaeum yellowstonii]
MSTCRVGGLSIIDRLLSLWVAIGIVIGLTIGKLAPWLNIYLQYGIPVGLFLMIYPAMVKIDLNDLKQALKSKREVGVVAFLNYAVNPFLVYFIGFVFFSLIFPGLGLLTPDTASALWTGLILLGVAPCIAMVLVWTDLAQGNGPLGIVLMAWNSIIQIITTPLYIALLVGTYVSINVLSIGESVLLYLGLPLIAGALTRKIILNRKGPAWFSNKLIPPLGSLQLLALLFTMVVMFSLQGYVILDNPQLILFMVAPLFLFIFLLYNLAYFLARKIGHDYCDSTTIGFHCTGRNFELAIAIALTAFAATPLVAVSTVIGPLIEIPVMLALVKISLRRKQVFSEDLRKVKEN